MSRTLEATELTRLFGRHRAVDGVSFVAGGRRVPGAVRSERRGKDDAAAPPRRPACGRLRGRRPLPGSTFAETPRCGAASGLISHQTMLYPALTALENVEFAARLHGVSRRSGRSARSAHSRSWASPSRSGLAGEDAEPRAAAARVDRARHRALTVVSCCSTSRTPASTRAVPRRSPGCSDELRGAARRWCS